MEEEKKMFESSKDPVLKRFPFCRFSFLPEKATEPCRVLKGGGAQGEGVIGEL